MKSKYVAALFGVLTLSAILTIIPSTFAASEPPSTGSSGPPSTGSSSAASESPSIGSSSSTSELPLTGSSESAGKTTVPEFGPVTSIVLAIAVLGIVVFAARTRIIPRL